MRPSDPSRDYLDYPELEWPLNELEYSVFELLVRSRTQIRQTQGAFIGFDYPGVQIVANAYDVPLDSERLEFINRIESEMTKNMDSQIAAIRRKAKANRKR